VTELLLLVAEDTELIAAEEFEVMSSAAMSLIVDREQVDDNDTDEDEANVAIISV